MAIMKITSEKAPGILILRPEENITFGNFTDFKQTIEASVEQAEAGIVLDFSLVNFICSTGIGVIANAYSTLKKRGGRMVLLKPREEIMRIFRVIGFDRMMHISQEEEEAVEFCKGEGAAS